VEGNGENLLNLLEFLPGCESGNKYDIQEWMNQDEKQEVTDSDILDLGCCAGVDNL
jgi:hypothetical protein